MAEYRHLPPDLFRAGGAEDALQKICDKLKVEFKIELLHRKASVETDGGSQLDTHRCMLKLNIDGQQWRCIGDGATSKLASKDAVWIAAVRELREDGTLDRLHVLMEALPESSKPAQDTPVQKFQWPPSGHRVRYPSPSSYPKAPDSLFQLVSIPAGVKQMCKIAGLYADIRSDFHEKVRIDRPGLEPAVYNVVCDLTVAIQGLSTDRTFAGARTPQEAERAAWFNLVAYMHASGKLQQVYDRLEHEPVASTKDTERVESVAPEAAQALQVLATSVSSASTPSRRNSSSPLDRGASPSTSISESISASRTPLLSSSPSTSSSTPPSLQPVKTPVLPKFRFPITRIDHNNAKYCVYDFAAKYGLVPDFEYERHQDFAHVHITLGHDTVVAKGVSDDLFLAEGKALLDFGEKVRAGLRSGALPAVVSSPVSCTTARDFTHSYATSVGQSSVEIDYAEEMDARTSVHWARILIPGIKFYGPYVYLRRKVDAAVIAYLAAAVELSSGKSSDVRAKPDKCTQRTATQSQSSPAKSTFATSNLDVTAKLLATLSPFSDLSTSAAALQPERPDSADAAASIRRQARTQTFEEAEERSCILGLEQEAYDDDPKLTSLHAQRAALPVSMYARELKQMVESSTYSIVIGDTGSGKTTQVPQILLEEAIREGTGAEVNIICTQPRRIAATSVADRVTEERDESLQVGVGYHVRFDAKMPRYGGSITYCTTGIFLQQMKHDVDGVLGSASHILIDEAHERDLNVDFLLVVIKNAIRSRQEKGLKCPRIVLMSATIDHALFANYLASGSDSDRTPAPTIHIPGRTFPVTWRYLHDTMRDLMTQDRNEVQRVLALDQKIGEWWAAELDYSKSCAAQGSRAPASHDRHEGFVPLPVIGALVAWICSTTNDGAILVFLPGLAEITSLEDFLSTYRGFGQNLADSHRYRICLLHSTIPKEEQAAVFERDRPGRRKIILSTNIAETSITVTDVKYVVDAGKVREKRYDQIRRITQLQCVWESKSNARQRAGRAGRVQHGKYYALYSKERYNDLRAVGLPEMLRTDLSETVLAVKANVQGVAVQSFLAEAIEPPPPAAVEAAIANLKGMEALTAAEDLTDLGRVLSRLPVHPSLGKPILLGILYRCLDPMILFGATGDEKGLFVAPREKRAEANKRHRKYFTDASDHMAFINAFSALRSAYKRGGVHTAFRIAKEDFLHLGAFKTCMQSAAQIENILCEAGLIPQSDLTARGLGIYGPSALNSNSSNAALVKCLLLAGQQDNLALKVNDGAMLRTATERNVMLHPGSMNKKDEQRDIEHPKGTMFTYTSLNKTGHSGPLFIRETSQVTILQAILFGGPLLLQSSSTLLLNKWLAINVRGDGKQSDPAKKVLGFRDALHAMHLRAFRHLGERKAGQVGFGEDKGRDELVDALVMMLATQG